MVIEKNLRMNTARKVLSATMPTKNAAIHSMESMKRSMTFLPGGCGPTMTPSGVISGVLMVEALFYCSPDAAQRVALAKRCAAEPGPYQAPVFGAVPALRSSVKNAAARPGHGGHV